MQDAYGQLFRAGHAHSVEVWQDNVLVGGLYGLLIGAVFCGESMFSRVTDASKVAFAHLVAIARQRGLELIDCQMHTPHLASLGARTVPRRIFLDILRAHRDRRLAFHL
jgi:leucyl/phenylalanyl-tRNA--protein transferase